MKKILLILFSALIGIQLHAQQFFFNPNTAPMGDSVVVQFSGVNTWFTSGNTQFWLWNYTDSTQIFGNVNVQSDTSATATFQIPLQVYSGWWNMSYVSNADSFTITMDTSFLISQANSGYYITGTIYDDANGNGTQDAGELGRSGVQVMATDGGSQNGYGYSTYDGSYWISVPGTGTYTVTATAPSSYNCGGWAQDSITAPIGGHSVNVNIASTFSGNDFGVEKAVGSCATICGNVWFDDNENGIRDAGEQPQAGINIKLSPGWLITTDANGDYCGQVPSGQPITVNMVPGLQTYNCNIRPTWDQTFPSAPGVYNLNLPAGGDTSNIDFGVHNGNLCYDVGIYSVRTYYGTTAGDFFNGWMDYKAYGDPTDTCTLRLEFDPNIDLISSSTLVSDLGPGFIEWDFPAGTTPNFSCMGMEYWIDTNVNVGDTLLWEATYTCGDSNDCCTQNNSMSRSVIVQAEKSSFEANTMEVFHTSDVTTGTISMDDSTFSYVVNFQNVLDDTVSHIRIVDTLPSSFVINSISKPFSSVPVTNFMITDDNVLIADFENVALPGMNVNEHKSYGFFQFNIILDQSLPTGTVINNKAYITFNHTNTVETNEVSNMLEILESIAELKSNAFSVFPNPSTGMVELKLDNSNKAMLEIFDAQGKLISSQSNLRNSTKLDLSGYERGLYFLSVTQDNTRSVEKVILK